MIQPTIDIQYEGSKPESIDFEVIETALQEVMSAHSAEGTVSLILTNDKTIQTLNREFRNIDTATDVLSFELDDEVHPGESGLGEVYISLEQAWKQSQEADRAFEIEVAHLAIHGTLHLLGYEHETDSGYAKMNQKELDYLPVG